MWITPFIVIFYEYYDSREEKEIHLYAMRSLEIKLYIKNKRCCQESIFLTSLSIHQDCGRSGPCWHGKLACCKGEGISSWSWSLELMRWTPKVEDRIVTPPKKKSMFDSKPKPQNVTLFRNRLLQMSLVKMRMPHNPIGLDTLKEDRHRERMPMWQMWHRFCSTRN